MKKRKVLHVAHSLPDIRVEKMMLAGIELGFEVEIALERFSRFWFPQLKSCKIHYYKSSAFDQLGFAKESIKSLTRIIDQVEPDIIHAHDIYNAYFVSRATPNRFVYDDHEFWSKNVVTQRAAGKGKSKLRRQIGLFIRRRRVPKWEKQILSKNIAITVSEAIAEHHRQYAAEVFVIENYPHSKEVESISFLPREAKLSVYIGKDLTQKGPAYRDASGFLQLLKSYGELKLKVIGDPKIVSDNQITSTGFIPHTEILNTISDGVYGILPWKPHENHRLFCPNKIYQYAHAGLHVILPNTFENHGLLSYSYFTNHKEIMELVRTSEDPDHQKIINHAKTNLIFEKRYSQLQNAYNMI